MDICLQNVYTFYCFGFRFLLMMELAETETFKNFIFKERFSVLNL